MSNDVSRRTLVKGAATLAVMGSALAGAGIASAEEAPVLSFTPGTYAATAPGRNANVTVKVTFSEGAILDAKVIEHNETYLVGDAAAERIPAALVADQHLTVDNISGATMSSYAVRTALLDCIEQAGGDVDAISAPVEYSQPEDAECDVLVVGAGGSGMMGAYELAKAGKKVILIEKADILGGTTTHASTYVPGWGTRTHEKLGVDNARDEFIAAGGYYYPDRLAAEAPELAERYLDIMPETLNTLMDYGADLGHLVNGTWQVGASDGSTVGSQLVAASIKMLEGTDVDVRTGSALAGLIVEDGKVVGGEVECKGGTYKINARAVYLCSGTYVANPELVERFNPEYLQLGTTVAGGNTGETIVMAEEVGAAIENMEDITIVSFAYAPRGYKAGMVNMGAGRFEGSILVDRVEGKRFANESGVYNDITNAMPNFESYLIIDQAIMDRVLAVKEFYELGYYAACDSPEAMAEELGLSELVETIETYTAYAQAGEDLDFGRPEMRSDLTTRPLYYSPVEPALHNPHGGLGTTPRGEVIDGEGAVIEGLWAATSMCNNLLIPCSTHGCYHYARIIAQEIAKEIA